jgi:hypothetical protein
MIISIILILFYLTFLYFIFQNVVNGKLFSVLIYIICFLSIYFIFQLLVFKFFESKLIIDFIKLSKDFVLFFSFLIISFGLKTSLYSKKFRLSLLDKLVILFCFLTIFYCFLPIGEASFLSKVIYLKNTLLIGVVYSIGRVYVFKESEFKLFKKIIIFLLVISFLISCFEFLFNFHLHSLLGYSNFNLLINDISSQGNFGLSWTFERGPENPRFGSIFPNPLEYSSNLLLFLTIPLYGLLHQKINIKFNLILLIIIFISFYFAYSRASILSALILCFLSLLITKHYKIIFVFFISFAIILALFYFTASDDAIYFIIDTFTFRESSSFSHLIEWIQSILIIIENPFGIGLAMSGNASGVDQAIKIGGENQFLIYGVQMGIISIILYSLLILISILDSLKVYRLSKNFNKEIAFIVVLVKLGLIIPLMTANAELYLFVSLTTWFFVGYIQKYKIQLSQN